MAIPTFVAAGTVGASQTAITPGLPAGWAVDDILLMIIETSVPGTVTAPGTWAHVLGSPLQVGSDARGTLLWKRAAGGETAPTVADTGDHQVGRIAAFRGCIATGNPWSGTPGVNNTDPRATAHTIPATTSVDADCLIVVALIGDVPDSTGTAAWSGWTNANLAAPAITECIDNHTALGDGGAIGMAYGGLATAGSSGTTAVTCVSSATCVKYSVALKPAAGTADVIPSLVTAPPIAT